MTDYNIVMKNDERVIFALRSLYHSYGYRQYKMSKFEEYDLYARNKDFLVSDNIIAFTDTNGRLMALKPDVTLSIVRSSKDTAAVQKVYYDENVYRALRGASFREIRQVGLECIGDIGDYDISEVLVLAAESLKRISGEWALSISHLGIVSDALDRLDLPAEYRQDVLRCIGEKNLHELSRICSGTGADKGGTEALTALISTYGTPAEVLPRLAEMGCNGEAVRQLGDITSLLSSLGLNGVGIDFSVVNDMNYYNGIVFKGFVNGVPSGVLSGGQYDKLMKKLCKRSGAVGFAVYLDLLERLSDGGADCDVDTVLLYGPDDSLEKVHGAVNRLVQRGMTVAAQRIKPEKIRYKHLMRITGEGVEVIEQNA